MFRSNHQKLLRSSLAAGLCLALHAVESIAAPIADGGEFAAAPSLAGDQLRSSMSFNATGGYLVWQDNVTDEEGAGISARRLGAGLTSAGSVFRVNSIGAGDQLTPKVAVLPDGSALFVWTTGQDPLTQIHGRWIKSDGTFKGPEFTIAASESSGKATPSVAASSGAVLVTWTSVDLISNMGDVFARRFDGLGNPLGSEFKLNQFADYGQRDSSVAAVAGGFAAAWVSESQRTLGSVDVYARFVGTDGNAEGAEFLVNSSTNICANPVALGTPSGGAMFAWSERAWSDAGNAWDVSARSFRRDASPMQASGFINSTRAGDQIVPQLSAVNEGVMAIWTSMGQDGADEGVYGRFLTPAGGAAGAETLINIKTASRQMQPSIGADGDNAMIVWSSHVGGDASFDLVGRRYRANGSSALAAPKPPFVSSISSDSLSVSWPELLGGAVDSYLLSVDGEAPKLMRGLYVTLSDWSWTAGSVHAIRLAYVMPDGRTSPFSVPTTKATMGLDSDGNGLPDDWEIQNFGAIGASATGDSDGDGVNNLTEFQSGTNPKDAASSLKTSLVASGGGVLLRWNCVTGNVYQVQSTSDFEVWTAISAPRFATSDTDSILLAAPGNIRYYRVILMR